MKQPNIKTTVIGNDHILLEKQCGCKLHVFLAGQYEEMCNKCKKMKEQQRNQ